MAHRKGQLSVEFYASLIIFLGFIVYIILQLVQVAPQNSRIADDEIIKIESYQISEILVNDGGHPVDWHDAVKYPDLTNIKRIGLSNSVKNIANLLDPLKIQRLKTICSNFNDVKNILDVKEDFSIAIIEYNPAGDSVYVCSSSTISSKRTSFTTSRTVLIDGTSYPTEIKVEVWKR